MTFPLLPGKAEALRNLANELTTTRQHEYDLAQETVVRESWFIQSTPFGEMVILSFEAPDPAAVFAGMAAAQGSFETWFKSQIMECTGVDLASPPSVFPEMILDWRKTNS